MSDTILEDIIQVHESAEAFISLFLTGLDGLTYLLILCLFGCDCNKQFYSNRKKLTLLIILDIFFRITHLYINSFIYSLIKELLITSFATTQFKFSQIKIMKIN